MNRIDENGTIMGHELWTVIWGTIVDQTENPIREYIRDYFWEQTSIAVEIQIMTRIDENN